MTAPDPRADPRLARGMQSQLADLRLLLAAGAGRVGWKIGLNSPAVQRHLGLSGSVVGYLVGTRVLEPGAAFSLAGGTRVCVEPEIAVHLGNDVPPGADPEHARRAIAALGPALEVLDLDQPLDDLEQIVAGNFFHRGVLFGAPDVSRAGGTLDGVTVRVERDGTETAHVDAGAVLGNLADLVRDVADYLGACGATLAAGDRLISGSLTRQLFPQAGDRITAHFGPLGRLDLAFTA